MTVIGIDDTDSRTKGMCTTYVGHQIAAELRESYGASISRLLLVRLNPAAKHKTRGNAAVAIHTDVETEVAERVTESVLEELSVVDDERTNPGAVIAEQNTSPQEVSDFTIRAIRSLLDIEDATELIEKNGFSSIHYGNGRGRIGALAAIGAWDALDDWTIECIGYRQESAWGTEREVSYPSVRELADEYYPTIWDTVDRRQGVPVCVPRTPCPILYGIRGDDQRAAEAVTEQIESEPIQSRQVFHTNQGTDVHLQPAALSEVTSGSAYRISGSVTSSPETHRGGHVFFEIGETNDETSTVDVAAFEPTKHFREVVRKLRVGDELIVCGEVSQGTLKLEKFAITELNTIKYENPTCETCNRSMGSAGANQGYRCRSCGDTVPEKVETHIERQLQRGWYEVPPCARRHIAKPLVRGDFELDTHPFK